LNSPIRVLHIADKLGANGSTVDGVARMLGWWFPLLEGLGVTAELLVLGPSGRVLQELGRSGIRVHALGRHPLDPRAFLEFGRVVREFQPELLHAHNWRATTFALIKKKASGIPVVVHEHADRSTVPLIQRVADRALNRYVDHVMAVSVAVAKLSVTVRGFPSDKVSVVQNAVPFSADSYSDRSADEASVRSELRISAEASIVGYVGRLASEKGPQHLLEAFSQLATRRDDTILVIVGDGPLQQELSDRVSELGLVDRCRLLGYRKDVARLQSSFAVQVVPSVCEGFGLTALEAMQQRVPLVATDIDGMTEIVEHNTNALVVPAGDTDKMAGSIETLLDDDPLRDRLTHNAVQRAACFNLDTKVREIVTIYSEVLGKRGESLE
jgi:glycosyltransferase involved in cell wall biosynthesis